MLAVIRAVYRSYWNNKEIEIKINERGSHHLEYSFYAIDSLQLVISLGTIVVPGISGDIIDRLDNTRVARSLYKSGLLWKELNTWYRK